MGNNLEANKIFLASSGATERSSLSTSTIPWSTQFQLLDKQPLNNTYILHHASTDITYKIKHFHNLTKSNHSQIFRQIESKKNNPSPYVIKLQKVQSYTVKGYCSEHEQVFLMWRYQQNNLKQQILNRRFKNQKFRQEQIRLVLQAGVKGITYLYEIGNSPKGLNTAQILISKDRAILLNDPWLSVSKTIDNNQKQKKIWAGSNWEEYPSPEKILFLNDLISDYNEWYSTLFTFGIIVLEMIFQEPMDGLYEKDQRKIHFHKISQNQLVPLGLSTEQNSFQQLKQDLRRLLTHQPRIRQSVYIKYKKFKSDYLFMKKPKQDFVQAITPKESKDRTTGQGIQGSRSLSKDPSKKNFDYIFPNQNYSSQKHNLPILSARPISNKFKVISGTSQFNQKTQFSPSKQFQQNFSTNPQPFKDHDYSERKSFPNTYLPDKETLLQKPDAYSNAFKTNENLNFRQNNFVTLGGNKPVNTNTISAESLVLPLNSTQYLNTQKIVDVPIKFSYTPNFTTPTFSQIPQGNNQYSYSKQDPLLANQYSYFNYYASLSNKDPNKTTIPLSQQHDSLPSAQKVFQKSSSSKSLIHKLDNISPAPHSTNYYSPSPEKFTPLINLKKIELNGLQDCCEINPKVQNYRSNGLYGGGYQTTQQLQKQPSNYKRISLSRSKDKLNNDDEINQASSPTLVQYQPSSSLLLSHPPSTFQSNSYKPYGYSPSPAAQNFIASFKQPEYKEVKSINYDDGSSYHSKDHQSFVIGSYKANIGIGNGVHFGPSGVGNSHNYQPNLLNNANMTQLPSYLDSKNTSFGFASKISHKYDDGDMKSLLFDDDLKQIRKFGQGRDSEDNDFKLPFQNSQKISGLHYNEKNQTNSLGPIRKSEEVSLSENYIISNKTTRVSLPTSNPNNSSMLQTPQRNPVKGRLNSTIRQVSQEQLSHSANQSITHSQNRSYSHSLSHQNNTLQIISKSPQIQKYDENIQIGTSRKIQPHNSSQVNNTIKFSQSAEKNPNNITINYQDGSKYIGEVLREKRHGSGILYYSDGRVAYQGSWYEDNFHGNGRIYNPYADNIDSSTQDCISYFDLSEADDFMSEFNGTFNNDKKEGRGKLKLYNGEIYNGQFKNDLPEGEGKFYAKDGKIIEGIWQQGKLKEQKQIKNLQ